MPKPNPVQPHAPPQEVAVTVTVNIPVLEALLPALCRIIVGQEKMLTKLDTFLAQSAQLEALAKKLQTTTVALTKDAADLQTATDANQPEGGST